MKGFDCTIYVTNSVTVEEFRKEVAAFLNMTATTTSFMTNNNYEVSIRRNDEFNQNKQKDFPDGFLYFKFIIDIGFTEKCSIEYCVQEIGKILLWLWEKKMSAVASYDYEDLLPYKGGYNNPHVPW